ncbi:MAG: biotin transporter BioY [Firmicutes bacterium]|nr:biotin transporter BioY [Bacillota bacterium]
MVVSGPSVTTSAARGAGGIARSITVPAMFAAMMCASAAISIPLPGSAVPITFQVFVTLLAGAVAGPRAGTMAVIVYILLGSAGLPVFSMMRGGFSVLLGPTGGYLAAFPLATAVVGLLAGPSKRAGVARTLVSMIAGLAVIYFVGTLRLAWITGKPAGAAASVAVVPFIPLDTAKAVAAAVLAPRLRAIAPLRAP